MSRPPLGTSKTVRFQLKITSAELEAIDDWRFANRVPSLSEAVRRLCKLGMGTGQSKATTSDNAVIFGIRTAREIEAERLQKKGSLAGDISKVVFHGFPAPSYAHFTIEASRGEDVGI